MDELTIFNLTLAIALEVFLVLGVKYRYVSWQLVTPTGLYLSHLIGFYIAVTVLEPGLTQQYTDWSVMLRTHGLITILFTAIVYWYERRKFI